MRGGLMRVVAGFDRNDRKLGLNFAAMMLRDRFLGTGLGTLWAILQPASLIGVYVIVFSYLFKSRLPENPDSDLAFVIWLVSGYGPWLAINEGLMSGANAVTGQSNLVKNMAFKTELLPISASLLGFVPLLVSVGILTGLIILDGREPDITWSIIPLVLVLQMTFVAGLGLMLGAINVFIRDLTLALPTILTVLLFLSPVFYPITLFPEPLQPYVQWNPIYVIANGYRAPIAYGEFPPWWQLVYLAVLAVVTYTLGLAYFRTVKNHFHGRL